MGKIGSILTDLVIDTFIIERSEWCTPIDGSGIKITTLPDNLFRVYYALLLRQRKDAKDDKWPKLLKLEMAKTQTIRGGKEYVFMMIFGDSNCTKPQGEGNSSWCIEGNGVNNSKLGVRRLQFSRCDKTLLIMTNETLIAPNGAHFVCGNKAYPFLPKGWRGRCYLAYLLPAMRVVSEDYVKQHLIMTHSKRSISETEKWLGRFIPFLGVTDSQNELQALHEAFEATANTTLISIANISDEVRAMRKVVLQNRMALDILLASEGRTCKVIATECCSYIADNTGKAVHNLAKVLHERIAKLNEDHGLFSSDWDTWFKSILGPLWNHLKAPLVVTVSGVFIILLLYIVDLSCKTLDCHRAIKAITQC
uniref:Uncharacterized protein n=1 Tax=Sinocyclocheilus rhinocerous TaxID=307959 RepID=A0A673N5W0_9TELE